MLTAVALCALAACDWLRGGTYTVSGIDAITGSDMLNVDQRDFFQVIDSVPQSRGMRAAPCAAGVAERSTCRTYETAKGIFLTGFLDLKRTEYVVSVYEWNVRNRSPLAVDIETEVLAKLRDRFGDKVITQHRDGV